MPAEEVVSWAPIRLASFACCHPGLGPETQNADWARGRTFWRGGGFERRSYGRQDRKIGKTLWLETEAVKQKPLPIVAS